MKEVSSIINYLLYNDMYVDIFKLIDAETMSDEWFFISRSTWDPVGLSLGTAITNKYDNNETNQLIN